MSVTRLPAALRKLIVERAGNHCEYCQLPAAVAFFSHEVDHVIAEKHGGTSEAENPTLACWRCNRHKGSDLGSFDPLTGMFHLLFNPRKQIWEEHFAFQGEQIIGLTPEGRTTISLLQLASDLRRAERRSLQSEK